MGRKLLITIGSFIFIPFLVAGQVTDNSQFPSGLKWKRIRSEHFDIIFPEAIVNDAQRVANTLEHVYGPLSYSLQKPPKRYPLILSNQNVEANGYVAWAPRRAEFYSTPPQGSFLGTGDWYSMLAIHEGRHMVQYDKFNHGLLLIPYILFGELGTSVATAYYFPLWLWEGDAVATETALSSVGRGRLPEFDRDFRTIVLSDKKYSYFKAYNRSYRDYFPDHYVLGYHMITHLRRQGDVNTLSNVIKRTTRSFFIPYPLNRGLRRETHGRTRHLYNNTVLELDSLWSKQIAGLPFTNYVEWDTKKKRCWTNYNYPQYISDNSIVAQKYGLDHTLTLVKLNKDGKEERLLQFAPTEQIRVPYANGRMVWSETVPSVRWGNRNYSVIKVYDINSGYQKRITSKSKLFAPSISNDGKKITAVEFSPERKSSLVILDAATGDELTRISNPENRFISTPSWSLSGKEVLFISQKSNHKYLTIQNLESGAVKDIGFGNENITNPVFYDKYILYNSPYSAIDNIYAIDTATLERFQITSDKFGAYHPSVSPDGKKMSYATYTVDGFNVAETDLNPEKWKKISSIEVRDIGYYKPLVTQEQAGDVISDIPDNKYKVDHYPLFYNFKPHSWVLLPLPPTIQLAAYSNDLLNNTSFDVGGQFNANEFTYSIGGSVSYSGLFPIFNMGINYTTRSDSSTVYQYKDTWEEKTANFGVTIPFDFSRGVYSRRLELGANLQFKQVIGKDIIFNTEGDVNDGYMLPLNYHFSFLNEKTGSVRDFNPPFAQQLNIDYTYTPFVGDYTGEFLSARAAFFLPGFFRHHSIRICGNYERQQLDSYIFPSNFLFPRGYTAYAFPTFVMGSVDYSFPMFYPDWSLRHWLYIKRFIGNLYYDYGQGLYKDHWYSYRSTGAVIAMNFIPFSLPPNVELEIGVRFSYLFDNNIHDQNYSIDPVLSIYF
jgi:hypothetical protein